MSDKRDIAHEMVHDLGLNPSLDKDSGSDKRLQKLREMHAEDAALESEKEDP